MNREQKAAAIEEVATQIQESEAVFAVDYRGISVPQAAELRTRLTELGAEKILVNTPAEARAYVDAEMARWQGVLREAGVRPQ